MNPAFGLALWTMFFLSLLVAIGVVVYRFFKKKS